MVEYGKIFAPEFLSNIVVKCSLWTSFRNFYLDQICCQPLWSDIKYGHNLKNFDLPAQSKCRTLFEIKLNSRQRQKTKIVSKETRFYKIPCQVSKLQIASIYYEICFQIHRGIWDYKQLAVGRFRTKTYPQGIIFNYKCAPKVIQHVKWGRHFLIKKVPFFC